MMDEYHRSLQSIEIVWTGPSFHGCTLRRTDQVLLDLIQSAKEFITQAIARSQTAADHSVLNCFWR